MDTAYLKEKFTAALFYPDYLQTGSDEHQRRLSQAMDASALTESQTRLAEKLHPRNERAGRQRHLVRRLRHPMPPPATHRLGQPRPRIHLRFLDRDLHKDLSSQLVMNGGVRVPVAIFMAEDFEHCSISGERPLSRYRALARKQLGESCEKSTATEC